MEKEELKKTRYRLSEQAALMLNLKGILEQTPANETENRKSKKYSNFSVFRGEASSSGGHLSLTKKLFRSVYTQKLIKDIPNEVLSSLLPSIKLYKVFFPKEPDKVTKQTEGYSWRIPFDDISVAVPGLTSKYQRESFFDTDKIGFFDSELLNDGRMHGVGIKSFTYAYKGTNPAETNTNLEATLELYFQNVHDLVKEIDVNKENFSGHVPPNLETGYRDVSTKDPQFKKLKFSYSDLVADVAMRVRKKDSTEPYNEHYYRIKVVVGYANLPDDYLENLGYSGNELATIKNAIRSANVILYLNPYNHDITFEENGSIIIKINYIAAMTSILSSINCLEISKDLFKKASELESRFVEANESKKKRIDEVNSCTTLTDAERESRTSLIEREYEAQLFQQELTLGVEKNKLYSSLFNILVGKEGYADRTPTPMIYSITLNKKALGIKEDTDDFEDESGVDENKTRLLALAEAKQFSKYKKINFADIADRVIIDNFPEVSNITQILSDNKVDFTEGRTALEQRLDQQIIAQNKEKIAKLLSIEQSLSSSTLGADDRAQLERERDSLEGDITDRNDPNKMSWWQGTKTKLSAWVKVKWTEQGRRDDLKEQTTKAHEIAATENDKSVPEADSDRIEYDVPFVFLGDIFDIVCSTFRDYNVTERPRIISTEFDLGIPDPSTVRTNQAGDEVVNVIYRNLTVNLADLPISVLMLENFLLEKVIKTGRMSYPLMAFFTDLMTDVIGPAVSPAVFGRSDVMNKSVRTSILNLTLPFVADRDLITQKPINDPFAEILDPSRLDNNLATKVIENSYIDGSVFGNYVIFYCSNKLPNDIKNNAGNFRLDEEDGVYHFFVGTDRSLMKKISFKRQNSPYYKESRNTGPNGQVSSAGRMREVYDVDITMFGNNVYRPGDYFYVEPLFFTGGRAVELQNKIGLGGYYQVIDVQTSFNENIYETKINATLYGHIENGQVIEDGADRPCSTGGG